MAALSPYEIWITLSDGTEQLLMVFNDEIGLSDTAAKAAATQTLQDIIDKIATPSPHTVVVRKGLISPVQAHIRVARVEDGLAE